MPAETVSTRVVMKASMVAPKKLWDVNRAQDRFARACQRTYRIRPASTNLRQWSPPHAGGCTGAARGCANLRHPSAAPRFPLPSSTLNFRSDMLQATGSRHFADRDAGRAPFGQTVFQHPVPHPRRSPAACDAGDGAGAAPPTGLEPVTLRLTVECSAIELRGKVFSGALLGPFNENVLYTDPSQPHKSARHSTFPFAITSPVSACRHPSTSLVPPQ